MRTSVSGRVPVISGVALFGGLVVAGFVAIGLGWRVAAGTSVAPFQVPALISGGLGGLVLVCLGSGLVHVHMRRRFAAREHAEADAAIDELAAIVLLVKSRRTRP